MAFNVVNFRFNLREIVKQCILLENHLNIVRQRCAQCITKHFLSIEAYFDEMFSLMSSEEIDQHSTKLEDYHERVHMIRMAVDTNDYYSTARELRIIRKDITFTFLDGYEPMVDPQCDEVSCTKSDLKKKVT